MRWRAGEERIKAQGQGSQLAVMAGRPASQAGAAGGRLMLAAGGTLWQAAAGALSC